MVYPKDLILTSILGVKAMSYCSITPEGLAYWYLRLNGFLTITNFVVHPDMGRDQETDVDILGVRFPFRKENLRHPMQDAPIWSRHGTNRALIALVEVKAGRCALNGPWTKPERENMLRVLQAVGAMPHEESKLASTEIHKTGRYSSQLYTVMIVCIGGQRNVAIEQDYPQVPQILFSDTLEFIYDRFQKYRRQKVSHGQWDDNGKNLWNAACTSRSFDEFRDVVRIQAPA